ncbi:hypothetical protein CZ797_14420 [Pseudoalteromonas sp. JB197]|nr:hypothetical protein CZ797_14420 [Pseudoalteromonas sp. JB197]
MAISYFNCFKQKVCPKTGGKRKLHLHIVVVVLSFLAIKACLLGESLKW